MAGLNVHFVMGNLTHDAELRYTQTGTAVTTLRVACNRRIFNSQTQQVTESVEYVTGVLWGKRGEVMAKKNLLAKGQGIFFMGRQETTSYEAQDGSRRYATKTVIGRDDEDLQLIGGIKSAQTQLPPQDEAPPPVDFPEEELPFG